MNQQPRLVLSIGGQNREVAFDSYWTRLHQPVDLPAGQSVQVQYLRYLRSGLPVQDLSESVLRIDLRFENTVTREIETETETFNFKDGKLQSRPFWIDIVMGSGSGDLTNFIESRGAGLGYPPNKGPGNRTDWKTYELDPTISKPDPRESKTGAWALMDAYIFGDDVAWWQKLLTSLRQQEAVADMSQRIKLRQQIAEIEEKIRELGG